MDEQVWLNDLKLKFEFLRTASVRKLHLFAVTSCRCYEHLFVADYARRALETAERFIEGLTDETELQRMYDEIDPIFGEALSKGKHAQLRRDYATAAHYQQIDLVAGTARGIVQTDAYELFRVGFTVGLVEVWRVEWSRAQAPAAGVPSKAWEIANAMFRKECELGDQKALRLFLEMFGNPFRPVSINPAWLTPTVTALARSIFDDRAFTDLPVLADALEEAGCNSQEVLDHFRDPGPHVLGCWALDLVLGKSWSPLSPQMFGERKEK
jgi:hypothetical protein